MYKIKLRKTVTAEITILKGEKSGETKINEDDRKTISSNREEILSSALSIETMIDYIISNLFFERSSDLKLFKEIFLSQEGVTLHTKERALSRLLEAKKVYTKDSDRTQLISKIANVK